MGIYIAHVTYRTPTDPSHSWHEKFTVREDNFVAALSTAGTMIVCTLGRHLNGTRAVQFELEEISS